VVTIPIEIVEMNIIGTISPPMAAANDRPYYCTEMLAVASNGKVLLLDGMLLPAVQGQPSMMMGNFIMWDSFFDIFTELVHGKHTASSQGTYALMQ
jgi:hypothetical protein